MKTKISILLISVLGLSIFSSCEKNKDTPPEIPPYSTMAIDFSKFTTDTKSAQTDTTQINYASAGLTIFAWNVALTATLVVPVAAFYQSFENKAEYLGDKTWQWNYNGSGFANTYHARLVGTIRENDVKWEMYISKSGIGAHEEFLWFEGTSKSDGTSGQWILYHSYAIQNEVLQIDWKKTGNEVGQVKYTYVYEPFVNGTQLTVGSSLTYGLTDGDLDAFYNIEYSTRERSSDIMLKVNIEWSTTTYNGRIKAEHYFQDQNWHCWDSQGYDTLCE